MAGTCPRTSQAASWRGWRCTTSPRPTASRRGVLLLLLLLLLRRIREQRRQCRIGLALTEAVDDRDRAPRPDVCLDALLGLTGDGDGAQPVRGVRVLLDAGGL